MIMSSAPSVEAADTVNPSPNESMLDAMANCPLLETKSRLEAAQAGPAEVSAGPAQPIHAAARRQVAAKSMSTSLPLTAGRNWAERTARSWVGVVTQEPKSHETSSVGCNFSRANESFASSAVGEAPARAAIALDVSPPTAAASLGR